MGRDARRRPIDGGGPAGPRSRPGLTRGDPGPDDPPSGDGDRGNLARGCCDRRPAAPDAVGLGRGVRRPDPRPDHRLRRGGRRGRRRPRRLPRPPAGRPARGPPRRPHSGARPARIRGVRAPRRGHGRARDPPVHERFDLGPEGSDAPAPLRRVEPRRGSERDRLEPRRRRGRVVAAALPRPRAHRGARALHEQRHRSRSRRPAGLPGIARPMDGVDVGLRRDLHRRTQLLLRPRCACDAPRRRPRPVPLAPRPQRCRARRPGRRRRIRRGRGCARLRSVCGVPGIRDGRVDRGGGVPGAVLGPADRHRRPAGPGDRPLRGRLRPRARRRPVPGPPRPGREGPGDEDLRPGHRTR